MNYILILYTAYLLVTIVLTVWVAHTLFKNGQMFLVDIFHGNKELAEAVNNLLWVGFYLVNIGYAVYTLKTYDLVDNTRQLVEVLSLKLGAIILILGGMHFMNMFIFFRLRKRTLIDKRGNNHYDYRNDPENLATYRVNIPNE